MDGIALEEDEGPVCQVKPLRSNSSIHWERDLFKGISDGLCHVLKDDETHLPRPFRRGAAARVQELENRHPRSGRAKVAEK
jgi:hypothetical protein